VSPPIPLRLHTDLDKIKINSEEEEGRMGKKVLETLSSRLL
jgi:hypothetical protein